MARDLIIWETDHRSLKLSLKKFYLILRADHSLKILIAILLAAAILIGLSGYYIPPYKTTQTYSDQMYKYQIEKNGLNYPNQNLNLYALAPGYPITITIEDSQHTVLDYKLYFINDTGLAMGLGPTTLIQSGQISDTTTLVIPHTIYHMTYRLYLDSPGLPEFKNTVTYTQTLFLYPPANYYLLIPGILLGLAGIVMVGSMLISINSDKDKYYSGLKFKDPKDAYIVQSLGRSSRATYFRFPWYANIFFGILSSAVGFTLFGNSLIFLTWAGIILIIAGVSLILNGVVRHFTNRGY